MKKTLFFTLFVFFVSVAAFGVERWFLDLSVEWNRRHTVQRAYFFRNLRAMEIAMGITPGSPDFFHWNESGRSGARVEEHTRTIFSIMHRERLNAAFVFLGQDRGEYVYQLLVRENGRNYVDVHFTNRRIRLQ